MAGLDAGQTLQYGPYRFRAGNPVSRAMPQKWGSGTRRAGAPERTASP